MSEDQRPTCFIAMPVRTRAAEIEEFGDPEHWRHVMESLFIKAVREAGYREVVPEAHGAWLIHDRIITNLVEADMVLCDMSALNSNVFFELGVRTALNKPIALVYDGRSELSFDTSGINTYKYKAPLEYWNMDSYVAELAAHIVASAETCNGENPLWRQFGLRIVAGQPATGDNPLEAKLDLLLRSLPDVERLQAENELLVHELDFQSAYDARRHEPDPWRSKADGNLGIAAEAIGRYATRHGLRLRAQIIGDGNLYLNGLEPSLHPKHWVRITELGERYGVTVRPVPSNDDRGSFATPTPEEFMQQPAHPQDDEHE